MSTMSSQQKFGGEWSERKLSALRRYLQSYRLVLKNSPYTTVYIDAFAGAGTEAEDVETTEYRKGSPLIALEIEPKFHRFVFIEKDGKKLKQLRETVEQKGFGNHPISYLQGDANEKLLGLAGEHWSRQRAVAFLDPFALHVEWSTIQALAKTKAIDMWLLFPAMAVNRMLPKSGKMDETWRKRLNLTFGSDDWESTFYEKEEPDLFGHEKVNKTTKPFEILSNFVTDRLKQAFTKAHDKPLILKTPSGTPLFLLCFACGNEKGAKPALRIANHIINMEEKTGTGK